jgi:hypothetical protein
MSTMNDMLVNQLFQIRLTRKNIDHMLHVSQ